MHLKAVEVKNYFTESAKKIFVGKTLCLALYTTVLQTIFIPG